MHVVVRSIFNLRELRGTSGGRVAVLIDDASGVQGAEYIRLLQPWRGWLRIEAVITLSGSLPPKALQDVLPPPCKAVVIVSDRADLLRSVREECQRLDLVCIDSAYPPAPGRTQALLQEVAHHDFELGGLNEWDGKPTQYSQDVLQHLSLTHCQRTFPQYALPYIEKLRQDKGGERIEAIDIGCGAISVLRWGIIQGLMTVTGVDPLLDMYRIILERHGLSGLPGILCDRELCVPAEALSQYVNVGSYDFAFSRNALDHAEDPPLFVTQVGACLRPGGIFALEFYTREGTRENWEQLHRFDLYLDSDGQLVCQTQDGSVRPLVPHDAGLTLREVVANTESYTVVVLERERDAVNAEQLQRQVNNWGSSDFGVGPWVV